MYDSKKRSKSKHTEEIHHKHIINGWWASLFLGLILLAATKNGFLVFLGAVILILSLVMLIKTHHYHGLLGLSFRFGKKDSEKEIVKRVNEILKREKTLKKEEQKLKKEIEVVFQKALKLDMHKAAAKLPSDVTKDEMKKFLKFTDNLLGKIPDSEVNKFIKSKDYQLYKRILNRYKIK